MKSDLDTGIDNQGAPLEEKCIRRTAEMMSRSPATTASGQLFHPHAGPLPLGQTGRSFQVFCEEALDHSVIKRFATIAARHATRLAAADGSRSMTYSQLTELSEVVAAALPQRALTGMLTVGILLEHEARVPAAMLGVLAAGHCYVPLDAAYPHSRLAAIAAHSEMAAIICSGHLLCQASALAETKLPLICLDQLPSTLSNIQPIRALAARDVSDVAYILYTSGSTGAPKGVFQNHRGLLHDVMQYANAIQLRPADKLTMLYSASTGGALRDIWGALLTGASLHPRSPQRGSAALADFLRVGRPSIYHSVPVVLRNLAADATGGMKFPSIRMGYIAGDRLDAEDVEKFFSLFPKSTLYTGLGATETSTIYVHRFISPKTVVPGQRVPVGGPVPDRIVLIQGNDGTPVADGQCGEIVVTSPYLARGYWKMPELTAERFTADPDRPGWRRFRTGDIGRFRPQDGLLEHHGRADQMIKLRGHRIELSAVEAAVKAQPGVREAVAFVRPGAGEASCDALIAYWQPIGTIDADDAAVAGSTMIADLRCKLPLAEVPAELVWCAALPMLANFKIDRAEIIRRDAALVAEMGRIGPPSVGCPVTASAALVADVAAQILRMTQHPSLDQNLLALGMDSLALVTFIVALEQRFERSIPAEVIFATRTPARIGAWIDITAQHAKSRITGVITLRKVPGAKSPPLLWPHNLDGEVYSGVYKLLKLMPANQDWFGLPDPGNQSGNNIAASLQDHAALMLAALRSSGLSPETGAIPVGWSFAGRLAWELARQMLAAGWYVPQVIVLDAAPRPTRISTDIARPRKSHIAARRHFLRLTAHYHASRAPIDLGLIRAGEVLLKQPSDLGWRAFARSVTIATVPGNHSIFEGHRLEALADALTKILKL